MFAENTVEPKTMATAMPASERTPRLSSLAARPFGGTAVKRGPSAQHCIGNQATLQRLAEAAPHTLADRRNSPKSAESPGPQEPDENYRNAQTRGPDAGAGPTPGSGAATPSASLSIASTGYVDTAADSRKSVTFNAAWAGGAKEDYILVQSIKGYLKKSDGSFMRVTMYGSVVDFNFANFQIDSVDADPAYWSAGGTRWHYTVGSGNAFSATDAPGPMYNADGAGAKAHLDFTIAVYKSADVPLTTTGSISATPLSTSQNWSYYVNVLGGGAFSHT